MENRTKDGHLAFRWSGKDDDLASLSFFTGFNVGIFPADKKAVIRRLNGDNIEVKEGEWVVRVNGGFKIVNNEDIELMTG